MVLDVRAEVICNLGPIISGSVRDDHVQGQGLIFTTGELVIAGLITPAVGEQVLLAYITPDGQQAVRFPRSVFRITKSFANPLKNETSVSIADELAYMKDQGGGVINSTLVDALYGRTYKDAPVLDLHDAFEVMADRIGIDVGVIGQWDLKKQLSSLTADDYVTTMSDILASVSRFGYVNAENILQAFSYEELSLDGPVVNFDQVVDISSNEGGVDYSETPVATGDAQTLTPLQHSAGVHVVSGSYGTWTQSWTNSSGSITTGLKVTLKNGNTRTYDITETATTSTETAEPDSRTMQQVITTDTALVKVNSQIIQDYIDAGLDDGIAYQSVTTTKTENYVYEEIPAPPLSEQEQEQLEQEIESAKDALTGNDVSSHPILSSAGTIYVMPTLPTFRKSYQESVETISYAEALGRIGIGDYSKFETIPSGQGVSNMVTTSYLYGDQWTKEIKQTFVAYGSTQMGQQALSAAALKPAFRSSSANLYVLLDQFFALVYENYEVNLQTTSTPDAKPIPDYLANAGVQAGNIVIQGTASMKIGDTPSDTTSRSGQFSVPFLPDDIVDAEGNVIAGNGSEVASDYAEEQNRLLIGHRLGLQLVTALGVLPTEPLGAFHLQSNGITATYRTNGSCWTFDANSCLVSTDALYWGVADGDVNGPLWTPVAPGTTALPVAPEETVVANPVIANSVQLDEPVNVNDQAAVNALLASLPNNQTEQFAISLQPLELALPYKPIFNVLFELRLETSTLVVPLGIERSMGEPSLQARLEFQASQQLTSQVQMQVESGQQQVLAESFAAGLGLGGNLS